MSVLKGKVKIRIFGIESDTRITEDSIINIKNQPKEITAEFNPINYEAFNSFKFNGTYNENDPIKILEFVKKPILRYYYIAKNKEGVKEIDKKYIFNEK